MKNNNLTYILIGGISFVFLVLGYYLVMPSKTVIQTIPAEELVSINDEYQLYKNNNLGVSIKIPKTLNSCVMNIKTDEFVYNKEVCDKYQVKFSLKQILGTNKIAFVFGKPSENTDSEFFENALGGKTLEVFSSKDEIVTTLKSRYGNECNVGGFEKSSNGKYKLPVMTDPKITNPQYDGKGVECPWTMVRKWVNVSEDESRMIIFSHWNTSEFLINSELKVTSGPVRDFRKDLKIYDQELMDNVTFY